MSMTTWQRFFIEIRNLASPFDFTKGEGTRGVAAFGATAFPHSWVSATPWDKALWREIGRITGIERRALAKTNIYAPILTWPRDRARGSDDGCLVLGSLLAFASRRRNDKGDAGAFQGRRDSETTSRSTQIKGPERTSANRSNKATPLDVEDIFQPAFQEAASKRQGCCGVISSYNDITVARDAKADTGNGSPSPRLWFPRVWLSRTARRGVHLSKHPWRKTEDAVRHTVEAGPERAYDFT